MSPTMPDVKVLSIGWEHAMPRKVFVTLPVKDLKRSRSFFKPLGFQCNPQFRDDMAACMVIADDIYAMLVTHAPKPRCSPKRRARTRPGPRPPCRSKGKAEVDNLLRQLSGWVQSN